MIKESTIENTGFLDGWKTMKLVDVCIVERGSSPRPIKKYITDDEDGVNWIKIGDTKNIEKYISETNQKITKEGAEKSRFVEEGDFILSNSMSFGKPYIMKTEGYIHDGWFKLKLHDFVDSEYFYQLLSSPLVNDQFHNLASGSVVKNISGDLVKKVILPIPPLPQQKQLVAILDKAFAAIDTAKYNAEQNLQNAKELFESYLQNVFENKGDDWYIDKLSNCIKLKSGEGLTSKKMISGNFPVFGGNGIAGYHNAFNLSGDNIIIGRVGALCGNARYIDQEIWLTDNAFKISEFKYDFDLEFLNYHLNYMDLRSYARQAAQPVISNSSLKDVILSFPKSVKEQKQITQKLDAISAETKKLEAIYTQKIAELEELKKSVLQKAFSGQLNTLN